MFERVKLNPTLIAVGECMLELIPESESSLKMSFAGDVYNALVYAKRCFGNLDCALLTGAGKDALSVNMVNHWQREGINTQYVQYSETNSLGIYSISVDGEGERSFTYWRKDSAATLLMDYLSQEEYLALLSNVDLVFFSGITLGILADEKRLALLKLMSQLRSQGKIIAFDPNYRPAMFNGINDAAEWMKKAYQVADLALPGLDEHQEVFAHQMVSQVMEFCFEQGVKEVVVKAGSAGTFVFESDGQPVHQPFTPAPKQVDSTAAGDSFAGSYLASRLNKLAPQEALINANTVAGEVVQHQGGILSPSVFAQNLQSKIIK